MGASQTVLPAFMACLHESHRHIGAHSATTDHAKLHLRSPRSEPDHLASSFRPPRGAWCFWRRRPPKSQVADNGRRHWEHVSLAPCLWNSLAFLVFVRSGTFLGRAIRPVEHRRAEAGDDPAPHDFGLSMNRRQEVAQRARIISFPPSLKSTVARAWSCSPICSAARPPISRFRL